MSFFNLFKATPVKDCILVNVGDLLEMFSNGKYPATLHRVAIPKEEILRQQSRQSIVFFLHPHAETVVKPVGKEDDKKYEAITAREHVLKRFAETFQY